LADALTVGKSCYVAINSAMEEAFFKLTKTDVEAGKKAIHFC
jgi:hypothetical protein